MPNAYQELGNSHEKATDLVNTMERWNMADACARIMDDRVERGVGMLLIMGTEYTYVCAAREHPLVVIMITLVKIGEVEAYVRACRAYIIEKHVIWQARA